MKVSQKKGLVALFVAVALVVLTGIIVFGASRSASATEECVPSDPWDEIVFDHWQRYSWTGGPHKEDDPPPFPHEDWQPNVKGDPHGVGIEGAYFRSHGNQGNGDWFYLEQVKTVIHHPGVECPDPTLPPSPTVSINPTDSTPSVTPTPTVTPEPTVIPVPPTPAVPTPTVGTPTEVPPVVPTPEPSNPPKDEPKGPKPPKDHPKPPPSESYMACEDGVWVTHENGKVTARSGTCDTDTVVPLEDVREEGM